MEQHFYLAHHGIKGQRWGIRRFRNEDGSLTAEGKKRYNEDGTRKSHRDKLEERYVASGSTPEQARALAETRIRGERVVMALGAVAVTAAVIGAAHYMNKYVLDQYIPEDAIVKRITVDTDPEHLRDRAFYATTKRRDQAKYVGLLGNYRRQQQELFYPDNPLPVNEITMRMKGAKVASISSGRRAYRELLESNPEFAKLARQTRLNSGYEGFNRKGLISDDPRARRMQDIFYQHLHGKGYDGVIDINDIAGGFKARAPTIFFGGQVKNGREIIKSASYREVPVQEMVKADARERGILYVRNKSKRIMKTPVARLAAVGAGVNAAQRTKAWVTKPVTGQAKRDAPAKRRAAARLRMEQNAKILALVASSNYTIDEIAKRVGVSTSRVAKVIKR